MMINDKKFPISTDRLEFDKQNPRLVIEDLGSNPTDEAVMRALVKEADIGELLSSIVKNGYMDIEPLIVTKDGVVSKNNYRVLEGNRRLCAIKLLKDPSLAHSCQITMPTFTADVLKSVEFVTVYEVANSIEAQAFIGFKHINGPHRWNSYAKATFLYKWYISGYDKGITIEDISGKMGDNNSTVRSLIGGMLVLKQAENLELFDIKDRSKIGPFGFSHLYTALGRTEYREFLGLKSDWSRRPEQNPIGKDNIVNLKKVLQYIYGSKRDDIPSAIASQNPDLKKLGEVLINARASAVLFSTNKLDIAYEEVMLSSQVFEEAIIVAHSKVKNALSKLGKFNAENNSNLLSLADEMNSNSSIIFAHMQSQINNSNKLK